MGIWPAPERSSYLAANRALLIVLKLSTTTNYKSNSSKDKAKRKATNQLKFQKKSNLIKKYMYHPYKYQYRLI